MSLVFNGLTKPIENPFLVGLGKMFTELASFNKSSVGVVSAQLLKLVNVCVVVPVGLT